ICLRRRQLHVSASHCPSTHPSRTVTSNASSTPSTHSQEDAEMTRLRAGLIGLGMIGRHHFRNIRALESTKLVGVADAAGDPHGVATGIDVLPDVESLISRGLDYCVVAVPTEYHLAVGE